MKSAPELRLLKPPARELPEALSPKSIALCALVLGAAMVLIFGDIMIAGDTKLLSKFGEDVAKQELGRHIFNFGELAHGNFPLWCPTLFCGYPSFGGMQTGLLYPLNIPFLFVSAVKAINWSFIVHTFLGGMFMYLWLARQSLDRWACLAGAIMFAFCAPFYLRIYPGHLTPQNTIAWIPLVFLAIDGIIATPTLGWLLLGVGAVSMELLAGFPQLLFYTAIAAGLYTLARLHRSPHIWRSVSLLGLMNLFVLGLTCVQWWAGLDAEHECVRNGGMPYWFAAIFSLPPENWLTLVRPGLFGDLQPVPYWGRWNLWEMCLYFGTIGLFFSAVGLFHRNRRAVLSAAGIAVVMGVLATGGYSPHFRFFYDHVPGFNLFRCNARFDVLVDLFLIFLGAHGLDMLLRDERKRALAGMFGGALVGCAVLAAAWIVVLHIPPSRFKKIASISIDSPERATIDFKKLFGTTEATAATEKFTAAELKWAFCFLAAATAAIGTTWLLPRWRRYIAPAVVGLIAVESLLFAWKMRVSFAPSLAYAPMHNATLITPRSGRPVERQPIPDLNAFMKKNLGDSRVLSPDISNLAMLMDGVSDLWGYGPPCVIRRYAEFIAFTQGENPDEVIGAQDFKGVHRRFNMLRCKYVLLSKPNNSIEVADASGLSPLPKFLLVGDWLVEPRRDAVFKLICRDTFNPRETVVLERAPAGWTQTERSPFDQTKGTIRILAESTDWQEVEVTLDKPAILLETDLYTPNWQVRALPGSSRSRYELIPANYVLRGIPLQAGTHRLRIEYRPAGFFVGRWISLAWLAMYVALLGVWIFRRRRKIEKSSV